MIRNFISLLFRKMIKILNHVLGNMLFSEITVYFNFVKINYDGSVSVLKWSQPFFFIDAEIVTSMGVKSHSDQVNPQIESIRKFDSFFVNCELLFCFILLSMANDFLNFFNNLQNIITCITFLHSTFWW